MQHFILTYWPIISFSLLHVVSFIWSFSSLTGRVHTLERELENYKNAIQKIYPAYDIKSVILWTENLTLTEL